MKCVKCGKEVMEQDKCFMLRSIPFISNSPAIAICEDCAETTTVMDLYMANKIPMRNSDDDAIDVEAVVIKTEPYTPTAEEINIAENPVDVVYTELQS